MIKELIRDLAYDKISVAQALTRAKLIAHQIKNDTFKVWLNKELNGYEYEDPMLPDYRKIWAEIKLTAEFPFGRMQTFPVLLPDSMQDIEDLINYHRVIESISVVEQNIGLLNEGKGYIQLTGGQVQLVGDLYKDQLNRHGGIITSGQRIIGKTQLAQILELTKQKLIDTLQDLEEQFPEIENKYNMNEENETKVNNIITTNIYGNNNPLNLAAGVSVKQGDINLSIDETQYLQLLELGVQENELIELRELDKVTPRGNPNRKDKIFGWLGKVTASMAARGIYDSIPKLIEFVGGLV